MTDEKAAELRRLAGAATQGEWWVGTWHGRCPLEHRHGRGDCAPDWRRSEGWLGTGTGIASPTPGVDVVGSDYDGAVISKDDASFIAAANPAAVLDLLNERDALRARIGRVENAVSAYFYEYGAEHVDGCPEDETCECPLVVALNKALGDS